MKAPGFGMWSAARDWQIGPTGWQRAARWLGSNPAAARAQTVAAVLGGVSRGCSGDSVSGHAVASAGSRGLLCWEKDCVGLGRTVGLRMGRVTVGNSEENWFVGGELVGHHGRHRQESLSYCIGCRGAEVDCLAACRRTRKVHQRRLGRTSVEELAFPGQPL